MVDNYDSFVYNLVRYFEELDEKIIVYLNDKITIDEISKMNPEGIIISPGPRDPRHSGVCEELIKVFAGKIPILGICLGHQTIGRVFGANIIKGSEPTHGKVSEIYHDGKGVFEGIKSPFNATRYHSLIIDSNSMPCDLEITCETSAHVIMGIRHKKYLIEGVQFHPEAVLTEYGHALLGNFINLCKQKTLKERAL